MYPAPAVIVKTNDSVASTSGSSTTPKVSVTVDEPALNVTVPAPLFHEPPTAVGPVQSAAAAVEPVVLTLTTRAAAVEPVRVNVNTTLPVPSPPLTAVTVTDGGGGGGAIVVGDRCCRGGR